MHNRKTMKTTIEFAPSFTKWAFIFNGIVNTIIGINLLMQSDLWIHWTTILGILLIIAGPLFLIYGIILISPFNRAPKMQIDDRGLLIMNENYKKGLNIDWTNIKEITYRTFALDFVLDDSKIVTVDLPTTAKKTNEIKQTIRTYSEPKNIKIIGG